MKARPCKYCENPVASNAKRCPKCDGKSPYPVKASEYFLGFAILLILGWMITFLDPIKPTKATSDGRDVSGSKASPDPEAAAKAARIRKLEAEWNRLRNENIENQKLGFTDFSANDRRIVEIVQEIARLKEGEK